MILGLGLAVQGPAPHLGAASAKEEHRAQADALFTNHTLLRLSLDIPKEGMDSLLKAPRQWVGATLRDGATIHSNVAVHLKGGSGSFRAVTNRPGFTLDFNRFEASGRFHGLKRLHLNNGAQDPTRLSEFIGGQLFREAGVPAARAAHALLELNGERLDLYVIMEAMDRDFLSRYFGNTRGNLYGQTRGCEITNAIQRMEGQEPLTYDDLKALAAAVLQTNAIQRTAQMEKTLDLDRFLSMMAMEVILAHWDGYTFNRHNYRIYHDPDTGRMVFFPHDLDQLMKRQTLRLLTPGRGLISAAVLNTPALRARYLERVGVLATNVLVAPRLLQRVDQAVAALLPGISAHDASVAAAFTNNATEFKSRIVGRALRVRWELNILSGRLAPLAFTHNVAPLAGWRPEAEPGAIRLERANTEDSKPALQIKLANTNAVGMTRPATGCWRTEVLLEPGWYRFEGLVRCASVQPISPARLFGASLVAGASRGPEPPYRLTGDFPWQKLVVEFQVTERDEVDLFCELRANKGEAWFAADSLRLVRLPGPSPNVATNTLARAMVAVKEAALMASKDASRPVFHFRPPAQWMNDVCGAFFHQGRYHLFFQFNPWSDKPGQGAGWGHARSPNLLRWELLPPALLPDAQNGSILDASGCATLDGYGRPLLFFAQTPERFPQKQRQQWAALPEDDTLLHWRRVDLGLTPGQSGIPSSMAPSWADMFVFKAGGRTFATFKSSQGLVCEAQNPGLTQWKAVGNIPGMDGECPNLFPLEGRHVLIQSAAPINYRVGDFDTNTIQFRGREEQPRILDYGPEKKDASEGRGLYGTTVFTDVKGRTILLGWIGGFKPQRQWNGVMSLPRLLRLAGEQLLQEPIPELAQLHGRRVAMRPAGLTNAARVLEGLHGDALDVTIEIKPGTATAFGVRLRGPEAAPGDVVIRRAPGLLNVAGRAVPCISNPGEVFKFRFLLDKSVLEAFVGDGQIAVTRVIYPPSPNLQVEVFAEGGTIQVQRLEGYEMRSIW
jgi:sucrose-6-phosphate hydrolase SacC (GH32 family)